jgi:hypothetical protein
VALQTAIIMQFEKVHSVWNYYDGVRTGIADFGGAPHYFASLFDDLADDYTDRFQLFPVSADVVVKARRQQTIFKAWRDRVQRKEVSPETHPAIRGFDPEYDDLARWLDEHVKSLEALPTLQIATFRVLPGQEKLPAGFLRELEVAWSPASA